jgi:hypothetical protein
MTIREDILLAMLAAAASAPSLGGRIFRSRTAALLVDQSPSAVIRPADESVAPLNELAQRDFRVQVMIIARGAIPDQLADTAIGQVHALLCADPSFGGRAAQLFEESSRWTYAAADQDACELDVRYRVRLYTPENSLTAPLS